MKLDLVIFKENEILEVSQPVEVFDDKLASVVKAMFVAIHKYSGIGLAAIQIGVAKRIVIAEINDNKIIAINPEIVWSSEEKSEMEEGNLSLKDVRVVITRPSKIKIKYQNLLGNENFLDAEGLLAVCLQHEIEQLDGHTILTHKK